MKYITLKQIEAHQPCANQFRAARRLFGKQKRILVTVDAAVAVADRFDFDWLAENLLTPAAQKAYGEAAASAWKAYGEAAASAWKAYGEAAASAFARAYLSM